MTCNDTLGVFSSAEDDDEEWEVMEKDDMLMGEELGTSPSELMRSMVQHHLYEKVGEDKCVMCLPAPMLML